MDIWKTLNRGPVFRFFHRIGRFRENVRRWRWFKSQNRNNSISNDLMLLGCERFPFDRITVSGRCDIQRLCNIWIDPDAPEARLSIGERAFVGQGTIIAVSNMLSIGQNTLIGAYCYLLTNQHKIDCRSTPIRDQGYLRGPLQIGDDVWIGAHCVLMPNVSVGNGAVVGAGSIVTRNIPEFEVWAGAPARKIRERGKS